MKKIGAGINGVVIGKITKIEKHPDADKLVVCQVDVGREVQIVTGASNVFEGAYVPVAIDGSNIPGPMHAEAKKEEGITIKEGELRGVLSQGMLCGAQELGYDDKVAPLFSKDGIWILSGDWSEKVGMDFSEALELLDYKIDFEITPNRPDCLSMIGMAREAAATFGSTLKYPESTCTSNEEKIEKYIEVEVNSEYCKRYTARVIKDVKIGQSPWWLQKKLMAAGMRPINNIVDITNFVMLEYGQPLHAFDIRGIYGNKIVVDVAKDGEEFETLDGTQRQLDSDMLMINDGEKAIGLAGIMGGLNSEIKDDTSTIVLESANFLGSNIRKTSKKLGLRTESSGRYEKGIDSNLCDIAADRVCHLIEMLDCGIIVSGKVDICNNVESAPTVKARVSRINKVIGIELSREEMKRILESLVMKVEGSGDELIVTPPSVRQDLLEEVDFIEEIARMYGYDNIPLTLPETATRAELSKSWKLRNLTREILCGMGANEIQTFSFTNNKILDDVGIDKDSWERNLVELINPMGEDTAAMRTILTPGMLEVLGRNYSRNIGNVKAYEIGITFMKNLVEEKGLPDESYNLTIGTYGEEEDFFTLKGMIVELLNIIGIKNVIFQPESEYKVYHPGRCARILIDMESDDIGKREKMLADLNHRLEESDSEFGAEELNVMKELVKTLSEITGEGPIEIGIMGEVHPDVAEKFGIGTRAYCCEIMFDLLIDLAREDSRYNPLPKFPSTSRDIAIILEEQVLVGDVIKSIEKNGNTILEDVKLFDIYRGEQVEPGKKSVAISLTYRHPEKTLTDEETEVVHKDILKKLNDDFDAVLREM